MNIFLKTLSYPFTVIYYLCFGLTILIFHPIQWFCFNVFGLEAQEKSVSILNWFLLRCQNVLGTTFHVDNKANVPADQPVVIVSNHQSMWDVPPIIWYLRRHNPKFISKKELGKGIPSISYNLRHGGSVLIDRKDHEQAIEAILELTEFLKRKKRGGVIFPEGTRSRDGIPKAFKPTGLVTLFENIREGYVIPITINNSWKLQRWGMFPIQLGVKYKMQIHPELKISDYRVDELIEKVEKIIKSSIELP